jgi:RNA polymerase sigma-70 factor (ECF subfamily)
LSEADDRSIRQGNFRILFEHNYGLIYRFFRTRGIGAEDSKDLTQDVFVKVCRGLNGLRDEAHFESWLQAIARNVYRNEIARRHAKKRAAREVSLKADVSSDGDHLLNAEPGPDPLEEILAEERWNELQRALRELPEQMQRCAQLSWFEWMSCREIAALLGISINTVKAHHHRARRALLKKLG